MLMSLRRQASQKPIGGLNAARNAVALHAAGDVDGVAKEAVAGPCASYHTGLDGPRVDAHADAKGLAVQRRRDPAGCADHVDGHAGNAQCVVVALIRTPGSHHVCVANCLHLVAPMLLGQVVKLDKQLVKHVHHLKRGHLGGNVCKPNNVGKQNSDLLIRLHRWHLPTRQRIRQVQERPAVAQYSTMAVRMRR